ncbi:hypothetical protein Tco_0409475 [Tanacetum coccineum]
MNKPYNRNEKPKKRGHGTVFVRGFDTKSGLDNHKWTNPDSTLQRRSRLLGTDEEPEHFGDDELPRPPGLQRLAKSQRSGSNSILEILEHDSTIVVSGFLASATFVVASFVYVGTVYAIWPVTKSLWILLAMVERVTL